MVKEYEVLSQILGSFCDTVYSKPSTINYDASGV